MMFGCLLVGVGVWQMYPPAAWLFAGAVAIALAVELNRRKRGT